MVEDPADDARASPRRADTGYVRGQSVVHALGRALHQAAAQRRVPPHAVDYLRLQSHRMLRATRRLAALLRTPRRRAARRRAVPHGVTPPPHMVQVGTAWEAAVDFRLLSVRDIARDTLAIVARLLESTGVDYLVRDAATPGRTVVVVRDTDRRRVWHALSAADPDLLLYVRTSDGGKAVPLCMADTIAPAITRADRIVVYRNYRMGGGYLVGQSHGCVLELWRRVVDDLRAPPDARPGRIAASDLPRASMVVGGRAYPSLAAFVDHRSMAVPRFPIDVVYTWVDDRDPRWQRDLADALERHGDGLHPEAANDSRYRNRDELRYSLRSIALYADFVRRIHVVTAGQLPAWLDVRHPAISIVDHREIMEPAKLPTFNSHAVEARLHRIDGLAEHYLYLNDDFLLGREVGPGTFFTANGLALLFPDELSPIPPGPTSPGDRPVDSASKNVRDLMRSHFGLQVGCRMLHAPYPQRRSVLHEMEQQFPEEFERTAASRFRHPDDLNIPSCFSHYYAFATGRAVPGQIAAEYVNVGFRWAPLQMSRLLEGRACDAICLNETAMTPAHATAVNRGMQRFMQAYLPVPAPWEGASGEPVERRHVGEPVQRR